MSEMTQRGFTPAAEAYCALSVAAKSPTMRWLFQEYDNRALDQIEAAMGRLMANMTGAEKVSVLPSHAEITVTLADFPDRPFRGMVRDIPGMPRRVTNLDSGTEFFVESDTDIAVTVTEAPRRSEMDGCFVY